MSKERLLVLDGHSLAFRAFYSRPAENFITTSGVYTNAVHGFFSMLIAMIHEHQPTHIAAAFDLSRHSFRTDIYPDYKGGRAETPPEFIGQTENIQRLLEAMKVTWLTQENLEADDIIATLATKAGAKGMEVLVSSGDRDSFQLISDQVSVLYPGRSISETSLMTPQAVKDKYGVWPWQYPEVAALVGEKADNLPGVPLVGEKVAAQWINEYGGLEGIYANADAIKGKRGENLRSHLEDVKRNRRLNALRTDLELPVTFEELRWHAFDVQAVNRVCEELEFRQLRRSIMRLGAQLGMDTDAGSKDASPAPVEGCVSVPVEGRVSVPVEDRLSAPDRGQVAVGEDSAPEPRPSDFPGYDHQVTPPITRLGLGMNAAQFLEWASGEVSLWAVGNIGVIDPGIDYLFVAKTATFPDLETPTSPQTAQTEGTDENYSAVLVLPTELAPDEEHALAQVLAAQDIQKLTYDAKALRHALAAQGWELNGEVTDLKLEEYLADSDASRGRFAQVTQRILGWAIDEKPSDIGKIAQQMTFDFDALAQSATPDSGVRLAGDLPATLVNQATYAVALLQMKPFIKALLCSRRAQELCDLEYPLADMLSRMETTGIAVDESALENYAKELESEVDKAQQAAWESIGCEVNLASPKQLQEVLFTQLGLPPTRKTKTGYTTDAKALEELALYNPHPFLEALLYHRDRSKLVQIVNGLRERITADGRIHTTYGQAVAGTGRLSSIDPNLQNIPARTQDGAKIRQAFVAGPGFESLMSVDYSQIEMRLMAHMSGDDALIEAFASGEDLHRSVAALVFGIPAEEVSSTQRSQVKATSYGLAYGLSAFGLANQLRIPHKEAKALMEAYFQRFYLVRDYLEHVVEQARSRGYTETMFGRRRYFPGLRSSNRTVADMARRAALNAPIQGTAADLMKMAMLKVEAAIAQADLHSRVLLQVHDELIIEVSPGESKTLSELVRREMTGVAQLRVPLGVSVGVGPNWLAAAH